MAFFGDQKSSEEIKYFIKKLLKNQQTEIENLKFKIKKINEEQNNLKKKYEFVLETLLEKIGKGSFQLPIEVSNRVNTNKGLQHFEGHLQMSDIQILDLLDNSKATNRTFAVSVAQLIQSFSIDSSNRTLRNKLSSLEMRGFVSSIGNKPKHFFLTQKGLIILQKQKRSVLNFETNAEF